MGPIGFESLAGFWLTCVVAALTALWIAVVHLRNPYSATWGVGHFPAVVGRSQQDVLKWMLRASKYFAGGPFRLEMPIIGRGWFVSDPATLKFVLSTSHGSFSKGSFFSERTRDLFGHGILLATGESWKDQRRAGSVLVSPHNLSRFAEETLPGHLPVLEDVLSAAIESGNAVDLEAALMDYSLSVFGEVAFDADWTTISEKFTRPFMSASSAVADRFRLPFYWVFESLLPYGKRLRGDLDKAHACTRELVRSKLNDFTEEKLGTRLPVEGRGMLVKALLETDGGMDEQAIADSCLNFLTAGRDTTAQAITWTMYLLLRNPSYIQVLCKEIDSLPIGISNSDLAASLPLLEATISESLRLHPPIPLEILENTSSEPLALPNGRISKPGEQIMWSAWVMARLPNLWGDDAESFRPERWIDMVTRPTAYQWPVFHAGPRACLGRPLGRLEMTFALVQLLKKFDFAMAWDGEEREVSNGLTAPMNGGLPVTVRRRAT